MDDEIQSEEKKVVQHNCEKFIEDIYDWIFKVNYRLTYCR